MEINKIIRSLKDPLLPLLKVAQEVKYQGAKIKKNKYTVEFARTQTG